MPYSRQIIFLGHVDDIYKYLCDQDVFIYPSAGEGFGNALAEALGCGLACLAYSNTAIPEIFAMGFHGYLVEDKNEAALKDALYKICQNLPMEKEMSRGNIKIAKQVFNVKREISEYLRLLK